MKMIAHLSLLLFCATAPLRAQAPPTVADQDAVPITKEPHHHLILENAYVRVFRVELISPDATSRYRHDHPYVYMSIGKAEFTKNVEGKPEVRVKMANGQLGYSKGGFSQIIRTEDETPFYNITVELLHPQENLHSDCAKVVEGPLEGCSAPQNVVSESDKKNAELTVAPANAAASSTTAVDSPLAQMGRDDTKKNTPLPAPAFTVVLESDESTLKSATFPVGVKFSADAGAAGTLIVVEPLSQFTLDFSDGSSKLLSGGDSLWLPGGSTTAIANTSLQTQSILLLFSFKDAPKPAGN